MSDLRFACCEAAQCSVTVSRGAQWAGRPGLWPVMHHGRGKVASSRTRRQGASCLSAISSMNHPTRRVAVVLLGARGGCVRSGQPRLMVSLFNTIKHPGSPSMHMLHCWGAMKSTCSKRSQLMETE